MQTESEQLFEESKKYIPGGVNSPVRAFGSVGRSPIFIKKAKGSRIFDEDGSEYIDYVCSWGPGILGHAKETVIEAVKAACDDGLTFGAPTRKELEIAELITAHMPSMEMSRMVNSGTEAVMSAIRAARGFTGRDYIVKFKGCYHGHSDGLLVKAGSGVITQTVANSAGVPEGYAKYTLVAEYNDEESVKQLFDAYKGQIAAIIVEPVAANMGVVPPKAGFLEFLRDITQTDGALLIFDEVITGFRLAPGGAQEYFHIKPDLTTLGKIVGGGMPVGTYGGRREIMQCVAPLGEVYQAGTLSGNPIAMTAGIETLKLLDAHPEVYAKLEGKTAGLAQAAREAYSKDDMNDCYKYAAMRNILYRKGKSVEMLVSYEPAFAMMNEWFKQLYGESEGKDHKGIFPASAIFSTDLHSMGQFIQDGSRVMFETVVDIKSPKQYMFLEDDKENLDGLNFLTNQNMSVVNRKAMEGTILAHTEGGVPNLVIEVDKLDEYNFGEMVYFFERACAISGYMLGVNPFNQPGVESYKKNMFALLGKPGYEAQKAALEAKLEE